MARSGAKWLEVARSNAEWPEVARSGAKWCEMARSKALEGLTNTLWNGQTARQRANCDFVCKTRFSMLQAVLPTVKGLSPTETIP